MRALTRGWKIGLAIAGVIFILLAIGLFFVGRGTAGPSGDPQATVNAMASATFAAMPASATPGVQVVTATPEPATATSPAQTDTPVPGAPPTSTSVPSGAMPSGWTEVEVNPPQCTQGRRLVFNHDADGQTTDVFLTWGNVEVLNEKGEVVEDLRKVMRLTQDPDGERIAVIGGWRKFRFEGQPTQTAIDELVEWAQNELARNSAFACDAVNDYEISVQTVLHAPSEPVANTEPVGWSELFPEARSFVPAGDKLQEFTVDHEGADNRVTLTWFWANFVKPGGNNGCTATVITNSGQTKTWYQGARRTWEFTGDPSKDDVQALVRWWITKGLETEPNGAGCARSGTYTVLWQDATLAPADPRGRP